MSSYEPQKIGDKRYSLDVQGLTCPYPQVLVTRALETLAPDDTLEVTLNNPPSIRDIPLALKDRGYQVSEAITLEKGAAKLIINK